MTRVSYEPKPSFTHSPATSSRGLRPERSRIEKKEAAGEFTNSGAPPVQGTPPATGKIFTVGEMSPITSAVKRLAPSTTPQEELISNEKRIKLAQGPISIMPVPL